MTRGFWGGEGRKWVHGGVAGGPGGAGQVPRAPDDAEYLLGAAHPELANGRVVQDTATLEWDLSTAGIVRANVVGGGGGGGSGDVVGPASAVNNRFAAFDGITGKLIKDSGLSSASFEVAGAVAAHEAALDPHTQYLTAAEANALYATISHTHAFTDVVSVPTARILGRTTAGTGATEALTAATVKTFLDLAGSNTGDQTITLTGNVTGSGTGSFATTIAAQAVGVAKMTASATNVLFGRATAGAGAGEEIALTAAGRALIDDADATAQRTTLGLGTLATQSGTFSGTSSGTNTGDQTITLTGDVTGSGSGSFAATIANNAVSNAKLADVATATFKGRSTAGTGDPEDLSVAQAKTLLNLTGTNSGDQTITLTGDVTGSGTGSFAATIANDAVTFAKMQNASAVSVLVGRGSAAGTGDFQEITLGSGLTMTGTVLSSSGSGYSDEQAQDAIGAMIDASLNYVDATPLLQRAALTGDVTASAGSNATTIAAQAVGVAKMTASATDVFFGRDTAGAGAGEEISVSAAKTLLGLTGTNSGDQTITLTGDVTGSGTGSFAATIGANKVTAAKMSATQTDIFFGRDTAGAGAGEEITVSAAKTLLGLTGTNTGDQTITLTGDVTGSGTGSFAATIANDAVTNAKLANVPTATFKGRTTAATGDPEDLTVSQAKTLLNLTGTNSGDQTITLTGDVTGSGVGSFAATIANDAVTFAKMLNSTAASVLVGRGSASGAGDFQEITLGSGLSMTGTVLSSSGTSYTDEQAQDAVGAMVDGSLVYVDATPLLQRAALIGDVTASAGSNATTIAAQAVGVAKMTASATDVFFGRDTAGAGAGEEITVAAAKTLLGLTGTNSGDQTITLTGDVTGSGTGSFATAIANNAVSNAKLADVATATFKGRTTAGTGDPEDLTVAQAKTLLSLTGTNSGDQTITLTGDVTGSGTGSFAATIANDAVTYAKIQNVSATDKLLGRSTAGAGDIEEIPCTAFARTILDDVDAAAVRATIGVGTGTGDALVANPLSQFAATTSAQLAGVISDETGSGALVFGTNPTFSGSITLPNTGLHIFDTNASHIMAVAIGSDLTANRTLTITTGDADRTLTISASATISGTNTGDQTITLTGDVTGSGTGSFAATIAADAVTNAKLANVPTATFKGRTTASTGDPEDLTVSQAKTLLNLTGTNSGDEPSATTSVRGTVILSNDLEYTANEVIRADDIRITTSLFRKRQMQIMARFGPNATPANIDAVGMLAPPMSGNGVSQIIPSTTYCVVRFLANASTNSYRQFLDLPVAGVGGGLLRTGFDATCLWMVQTGILHTAIRMWLGLTTADLHTIGSPTAASVCAFRYDTSVDTSSTNWRAVSSNGSGGVQTTDTGVDAAVNGAGLRFMIQTSVTTITFYINDVLVATHSTSVPANVDLGHTVSCSTLDTANKRLDFGRAVYMHSEFGL